MNDNTHRPIYIGDLIKIEIDNHSISQGEIERTIEENIAIELVDIEVLEDSYVVTLRSFIVGEHLLSFNDQEVIVEVKSTLEGSEATALYEGDLTIPYVSSGLQFLLPMGVLFLIGIITGIVYLAINRKKVEAQIEPYVLLCHNIDGIGFDGKRSLGELSTAFKVYVEMATKVIVTSKTTNELVDILNGVLSNETVRDIHSWYKECDGYTYRPTALDEETFVELKIKVKSIGRSIEESMKQIEKQEEVA